MKLSPNVYLLSGFSYGIHQNVYGVSTPENTLILIDTGTDGQDLAIVRENIRFWGLGERAITAEMNAPFFMLSPLPSRHARSTGLSGTATGSHLTGWSLPVITSPVTQPGRSFTHCTLMGSM